MIFVGVCGKCQYSTEVKHPRGGASYWKCRSNESKIKYPVLPVLECKYFKESRR
jgi:hypothetical protein